MTAEIQAPEGAPAVGEIAEMDDGALVPVWRDGTPAAGTLLYAAPQAAPAAPVAWMREDWGPDCGPYFELYRDDEMSWRDRKDWTPLFSHPTPAIPAPAEAHGDAQDAARFRWLIDDRNWDETNDTPSVCTSEDVHWGDKARALIDRHMKG